MNLELSRALAVVAMAPERHEYNLGVLSMLGQGDLAVAHKLACDYVSRVQEGLDGLVLLVAAHPDAQEEGKLRRQNAELTTRLNQGMRRRETAWREIEVLMAEHQIRLARLPRPPIRQGLVILHLN